MDYLVVHCSATKPSQDIGTEEIRKWHLQKAWLDIGYHYVIRRNGRIEKGRQWFTQGAHASGFNTNSLGICMVGGLNEDTGKPENNFTEKQFQSLKAMLETLEHVSPECQILGHRDLPEVKKACPCFDVQRWWEVVNQ